MNIYEFMGGHPVLTFVLAYLLARIILCLIFQLPNRILRHMNIRKHGYPPEYCDADGDFKKPENE